MRALLFSDWALDVRSPSLEGGGLFIWGDITHKEEGEYEKLELVELM